MFHIWNQNLAYLMSITCNPRCFFGLIKIIWRSFSSCQIRGVEVLNKQPFCLLPGNWRVFVGCIADTWRCTSSDKLSCKSWFADRTTIFKKILSSETIFVSRAEGFSIIELFAFQLCAVCSAHSMHILLCCTFCNVTLNHFFPNLTEKTFSHF